VEGPAVELDGDHREMLQTVDGQGGSQPDFAKILTGGIREVHDESRTCLQDPASCVTREVVMGLEFIGIDPETNEEGSPTIWADVAQRRILVQGDTVIGDELAEINETEWVAGHKVGVPAHESVISIPERMIPFIRKACDAIERAGLQDSAPGDEEVGRAPGDA
jgi:hypothetical protein